MTQEQYQRVLQISSRLKELEEVKRCIKNIGEIKHKLTYAKLKSKHSGVWYREPDATMQYIYDLLDKHDLMIRKEIDEEIQRLKDEIKTIMKELSIEEKAKAYDDLLAKLQKAKVDNDVCDERYCCVIDDIVPELKESADEKTKRILHSISSKISFHLRDIFTEEEFASIYDEILKTE